MVKSNLNEVLGSQFEENEEAIRMQWVTKMESLGLISELTQNEIEEQSKTIYNTVVDCLKMGTYGAAELYATDIAHNAILQALTVDQIISRFTVLRDIFGRFLNQFYKEDYESFQKMLDIYEPVARSILNIVAIAFIKEREIAVQQQQDAILKLSTPLVQLWENIGFLPLIGILDNLRAKQLIESVLTYIGQTKTEIIIFDIVGIAAIDSKTAQNILMTIQASKLMGTEIVITGIRPEVATTLVTLGIDLSGIATRSFLQDGIKYAFDKLGLKMVDVLKK